MLDFETSLTFVFIETLLVDRNAIAAIPDGLGEVVSLRNFNISQNAITSVPDRLVSAPSSLGRFHDGNYMI